MMLLEIGFLGTCLTEKKYKKKQSLINIKLIKDTKHIIFPLGALNKDTKEYVYPAMANKIDNYACPDCNTDLIFCRGIKNIEHFRHNNENNHNPCNRYNKPSETQIHKDAIALMKRILEDNISITVLRTCDSCNETEEYEIPKMTDKSSVKTEYCFNFNGSKKKADVACLYKDKIICIFEIYNTHKINPLERPEPWFEFNANKLMNEVNENKNILQGLTLNCVRIENCDECIKNNIKNKDLREKRLIKLERKVRKRLGQTLFSYPSKKECLDNFINNCKCNNSNDLNFEKEYDVSNKNIFIYKCCQDEGRICDCDNCDNSETNFMCKCECCNFNKGEYFELIKQTNHLRFDFHSTKKYEIENNKKIIETFNDLFKNYRVIIHSYKGTLSALITTLYNYEKFNKYYFTEMFKIINEDTKLPYIRVINYNGEGTIDIIVDIIETIHNFDKIFLVCPKCNKIEKKWISETNLNNKICKSCDIDEYNRIYLNVPFNDKDEIKSLGGKFDGLYKKWYINRDFENPYILSRWNRIIVKPLK